mmetsp:Transcript_14008/g.28722  ORF Transcript_14008/g.28722 Transcript_14008/m.28722 type:complete len:245 (-) Transcript_14008:65-799(-)
MPPPEWFKPGREVVFHYGDGYGDYDGWLDLRKKTWFFICPAKGKEKSWEEELDDYTFHMFEKKKKKKMGSMIVEKEEKKKKRAKSAKPRITQEELLTECVIRTEPENKKWILGRRRMTDANEQIMQEAKKNDLTNVAWRFTSKGKVGVGGQGMFNSVTFPKVDNVPPILQRSVNTSDVINSMKHNPRRNLVCAVTGGKAKYYDPLTGMGYNDKEGFKVIREKYAKGNMKVGTLSYKVKRGKGGR